MFTQQPGLSELFVQLGLSADEQAIEQFISEHRGLKSSQPLAEAPFWSKAQASFLRQALAEDAEWAEVIDELNTRLH
ncbi:DUF2789 domain-containing protein [Alteromonas lipolytica]|uniref:DUF2789 domain-containing protein n=1 Tax=Alteromonas lipolytica TaxID=1856405 RepID=A0A1E8FG84_9ALTE|nr:DUF2789 domain-containing protein [Alteromonas lipolytica]OFI34955.1 hypothetical protein BFC17_15430 [Alteromonas lipolytica]GGF55362.1 hypothetical protein GCM10011338_04540 [Alteromonas lipolytica]